jgi:hypothetical protein
MRYSTIRVSVPVHIGVLACVLAVAVQAHGQTAPPAPPAPPADRTGMQDAQEELTAARAKLGEITGEHEAKLHASPSWQAANAALQTAQSDLSAAEDAVRAKLDAGAEYQKVQAEQQQADGALAAMRSSGRRADDPKLVEQSTLLQQSTQRLLEMRMAAFQSDAAWTAATEAKAQANAEVARLRAELDSQLAQDPRYTEAKSAVDAAQARVQDQRGQLAEQQRQRNDQARQQRIQRSREQQNRPRQNVGGGY